MECGTELVIAVSANAPVAQAPTPRPAANVLAATSSATAHVSCSDCGERVIPDANGWCPVCGHDFTAIFSAQPLDRNRSPSFDSSDLHNSGGSTEPVHQNVAPEFDEREFFREPPSLDQVRAARAPTMQQGGSARPTLPVPPSAVPLTGVAIPLPGEVTASASHTHAQPQLPGDRRKTRFQAGDSGGFNATSTATSELYVEGAQKVFFDGTMTDRIRLDMDQVVIGRRDPAQGHYPEIDLAHLVSLDPHISRRHARVYRAQGRWRVEDLSNNDATFVNDRSHILNRSSHELRNGDRILISDALALVFRQESSA
jgi:hypothetical protein